MNGNTAKKYRSHKKAQGLALLEILIAIGILGIIAAGVATLASRTFEASDIKDIESDMTDVSIALQDVYSRATQYVPTVSNTIQEFENSSAIDQSVAINPLTNVAYLFNVALVRTTDRLNTGFVLGIDNANDAVCTSLITGALLEDADYIEVVAAGVAINGRIFDTAAVLDVKNTATGINQNIYDPTALLAYCNNDQNLIIVGFN